MSSVVVVFWVTENGGDVCRCNYRSLLGRLETVTVGVDCLDVSLVYRYKSDHGLDDVRDGPFTGTREVGVSSSTRVSL